MNESWRKTTEKDEIKPSQHLKYDFQEGWICNLDEVALYYVRHKALIKYSVGFRDDKTPWITFPTQSGMLTNYFLSDGVFSFYLLASSKKEKPCLFFSMLKGGLVIHTYPYYPIMGNLLAEGGDFEAQRDLAEVVEEFAEYFPKFKKIPTTHENYKKEKELLNLLLNLKSKLKKAKCNTNEYKRIFPNIETLL